MKKLTKTQSGLIAIGIYFFLFIVILIYYSGHKKTQEEAKINNGSVISVDVGNGVLPSSRGIQTPPPDGSMIDATQLRSTRVIPAPRNSVYNELDRERGVFQSVQDIVESSTPKSEPIVVEKPISVPKETLPVKVVPKETTVESSKNVFDEVKVKSPSTPKEQESKYDESPNFEPSIRQRENSGGASATDKINKARGESTNFASSSSGTSGSSGQGGSDFGAYVQSIKVKLNELPISDGCNNGEKATIRFTIYNSGKFDFDIVNSSASLECKKELVASLNQLKRIGGFKPHDGNSAHTGNVNYHFN
ncbi:MAG: hypothetical protein KN64_06970 [Sulfurovum sp. AS07-7]|nr:MAG: hypothetical protein KN64_06970 [Sulfurovum sp. AS07-7]